MNLRKKLDTILSIFGLGNKYTKTGTIILDDSHACIDVLKSAHTITINKNKSENLYNSFLQLFEDNLRDQGEGSFIDIQSGNYDTLTAVPYWSWIDKKTEVLTLLSKKVVDWRGASAKRLLCGNSCLQPEQNEEKILFMKFLLNQNLKS